jgi:hypothetical protein
MQVPDVIIKRESKHRRMWDEILRKNRYNRAFCGRIVPHGSDAGEH